MFDRSLTLERLLSRRPLLRPEHAVYRPIRQDERSQHAHVLRGVLRMEPFDGDLDPLLDEVRLESVANHPARGAGFEGPPLYLAAGVLHIEKEPRVRVLETDLHDRALDRHRLVHVEGCRKRMMRP